ncbi:MAG: hypoxanthine phosphoribosyltransferase [Clostridia bacterium]|nr:hypoxanthine phosphoribosyltransferase [Clostridia bacterium]
MINDIEKVLISEEEINSMVERIAGQINEDYKGKNLLLICVLKGSVCFMSDLMKKITIPCKIDFMSAKSYYGATTATAGVVNITKDITYDINEYDILVIEDIFDSGKTLEKLMMVLEARNPQSVACCSLLDKPERRDPNVKLQLKYTGAAVPDEFVVGYGLDYNELYRNLPFVGVLKPEVYNK